nr:MAG TPA: hypothetical protein [Caudoviricetes sp.]
MSAFKMGLIYKIPCLLVASLVAVPLYIRLYSVLFVYLFPRKIINLLILKALKRYLKSLAFRGVPVQVWPRAPSNT